MPQPQVVAFTEDIRALCNVILIAAMDLEGLIDRFSGKSLKSHGLDANVIKSVTEMFEKWQSDGVHGPAAFGLVHVPHLVADRCRIHAGKLLDRRDDTESERMRDWGAVEAGCGATAWSRHQRNVAQERSQEYVCDHSRGLRHAPGPSLTGFESNQILNVLEKLLADQPILCEQFWGGAKRGWPRNAGFCPSRGLSGTVPV